MHKITKTAKLFSEAAGMLIKNQPLILASSTSFFTLFSIPPMIIITVNAMSLYFKTESIADSFLNTIADIFGKSAAEQMASISRNFSELGSSPWITVAGSLFLIFVATNLFKVIRISINQIWNIRMTKKGNLLVRVKTRAIALGIILLTGVFFLLSTLSDSVLAFIDKNVSGDYMNVDTVLIIVASKIISVLIMTLWFMAVFRFLPNAKVHWRAILTGAFVTSVLFSLGKYLLEQFLVNSNINNIFETSTSVVLIMLFIFYSSIIMYYGASFTFIYSQFIDKRIKPRKNAERYEVQPVD